jgi:predicted  nucleic acid-binding Zn-ribbon protein
MRVLEALVADNEALKRDAAKLQNMLTESREDARMLQEEVTEMRARGEGGQEPLAEDG